MDRLRECEGCGALVVDWNDPMEAWLGKRDAREGSGMAEDYGGTTDDGVRLCLPCWEEAKHAARSDPA